MRPARRKGPKGRVRSLRKTAAGESHSARSVASIPWNSPSVHPTARGWLAFSRHSRNAKGHNRAQQNSAQKGRVTRKKAAEWQVGGRPTSRPLFPSQGRGRGFESLHLDKSLVSGLKWIPEPHRALSSASWSVVESKMRLAARTAELGHEPSPDRRSATVSALMTRRPCRHEEKTACRETRATPALELRALGRADAQQRGPLTQADPARLADTIRSTANLALRRAEANGLAALARARLAPQVPSALAARASAA